MSSPSHQAGAVVVDPVQQQLGDGCHRADDSVGPLPWVSPNHAIWRRCVTGSPGGCGPGAPTAPSPGWPRSAGRRPDCRARRCSSRSTGRALTGPTARPTPNVWWPVSRPTVTACSPATTSPSRRRVQETVADAGLPAVVPLAVETRPVLGGGTVPPDAPHRRAGGPGRQALSAHRMVGRGQRRATGRPPRRLSRSPGRHPPDRRGRRTAAPGAPGSRPGHHRRHLGRRGRPLGPLPRLGGRGRHTDGFRRRPGLVPSPPPRSRAPGLSSVG